MNLSIFEKITQKPFYLTETQAGWVKKTLDGMSKEEKIGQLFCHVAYSDDEAYLKKLVNEYHAGGVMGRPQPLESVVRFASIIQREAKIPLLIAANFEAGGDGLVDEGVNVGPNLQVAATGSADIAANQGKVCGKEGSAAGANWAFAPVIDIEHNFRNPITGTRTYGADPETVKLFGESYVKAVQAEGVAACIKHFPGDGVDERDQHLVSSVNSLDCDEWDKKYGAAYKASIDAGALSVMAGHIMLPAYSKRINPELKDSDVLPASLSYELLTGLLRERLGFNGLIATDASTMAGFTIPMSRAKGVPASIMAGADVFLFSKNIDEDYEYMTKGVDEGTLTLERLDEAVTRILALKAALGLPEKKDANTLIPVLENAKKVIGCPEHLAIEEECSDKGVTLVKNLDGALPLSPEKTPRVLLYPIFSTGGFYKTDARVGEKMKEAFEQEGFKVDIFAPKPGYEGMLERFDELPKHYDLLVYVANLMTKSNQTVVRIEWEPPMCANGPIYLNVVPTVFISFANPYHLIDVPRIRTMINAYCFKPANIKAVMDKLMGRSEFKGSSPIDAFCGKWDTRL
jgi:beta-N-acetylhexosaminidase